MDQTTAFFLLQEAETRDGYRTACKNSVLNTLARRACDYTPWMDQTSAPTIAGAQVIILSPSADGGMPHTRAGNIICIPAHFPREQLASTLEHEMIHIDQRNNPLKWKARLTQEGWSPASDSEIPDQWLSRCRLNPDTLSARFWAWEGRYIPLPLFVREDKPELRDIEVRWYDRETGRVQPQPPSSFTRRFGILGASQLEHPYEFYAYLKKV
jgi:hypothetical protein